MATKKRPHSKKVKVATSVGQFSSFLKACQLQVLEDFIGLALDFSFFKNYFSRDCCNVSKI